MFIGHCCVQAQITCQNCMACDNCFSLLQLLIPLLQLLLLLLPIIWCRALFTIFQVTSGDGWADLAKLQMVCVNQCAHADCDQMALMPSL